MQRNRGKSARVEHNLTIEAALLKHDTLVGSLEQVRETATYYRDKVENACEFNLEEIEIRIESLKIEIEKAQKALDKKLRGYKRALLEINDNFKTKLEHDSIFNDVSMRSLDSKCIELKLLYNKHVKEICNAPFKVPVNSSYNDIESVGTFQAHQQQIVLKQINEADARNALAVLDKRSIVEMKAYNRPPAIVSQVAEAVCIILRVEPASWTNFKSLVTKNNFLELLVNLDLDNVPRESYDRLTQHIQRHNFNIEMCRAVSLEASTLCSWVLAVQRILQIRLET